MSSVIEHIEDIVSKTAEVAETKMELWKLKAVGKASETISSLISIIPIVLLAGTAIIILSLGGALWIGRQLGNTSYGFFIIGGFYILAGGVVCFLRRHWIKTPLNNLLVDKIVK